MQADTWRYRYAANILHDGGIVAYPTEAVFGLGCDPADQLAVESLLRIKQRPVEKGLILIASEIWQLEEFIEPLTADLDERIWPTWPGPVTWLVPARADAPDWITGRHDTVAVRVSDHPQVVQLCEAYGGALVSTSANPAGFPPARNELKVRQYFAGEVDYILHGKVDRRRKPSEIRDALTNQVLRAAG